jgi:hypothetical protein
MRLEIDARNLGEVLGHRRIVIYELHYHAAQASATAYCLSSSLTPSISTLMKSWSIFAELPPLLLLSHHFISSASIAGQPRPLSDASVSYWLMRPTWNPTRHGGSGAIRILPVTFHAPCNASHSPFNSQQTSGRAANQRAVRRCPYPTPRSPLRRSNSNFIGRDAQLCQRYPIP